MIGNLGQLSLFSTGNVFEGRQCNGQGVEVWRGGVSVMEAEKGADVESLPLHITEFGFHDHSSPSTFELRGCTRSHAALDEVV